MAGNSEGLHGMAAMRLVVVLVLILSAWLIGAFFPTDWLEALAPDPMTPKLPLVSAPYAARSDVISLVPDLFGALVLVTATLLLLEIAKLLLVIKGIHRPVTCSLAALAAQQGVAFDILRSYAPDWYGYGLYYLHIIDTLSHEQPRPDVLPIAAPWYSLVFIMALAILSLWQHWHDRSSSNPPLR